VPSYTISAFSYNAASFLATWTLARPIGADHLQISLANVRDSFGFALDGEWADGQSTFPSGDGTTGGAFAFHFNVLPGDIDQDGTVGFSDLLRLAQNYGASDLSNEDLNQDGQVNFADLLALAQNYGATTVATITPQAAARASIRLKPRRSR
jgi:hypothetical protein